MERLYFAYGSNLDPADWGRFCKTHGYDSGGLRFMRRAWLPDHEVSFRYRSSSRGAGALTLEPQAGAAVPGALFSADEATWGALDRKEGVSEGRYARVDLHALDEEGQEHACVAYQVTPEHHTDVPVLPTSTYHNIVRGGLEQLGMSTSQLDAAARGERPPITPHHFFLYGTLMKGECRWHHIEPHVSGLVQPAVVRGALIDLGRYPGLTHGSPDEGVTGDLIPLQVSQELMRMLDEIEVFEGYGRAGSLYRRVLREAQTSTGSCLAWTYLYLGVTEGKPRIDEGAWRGR